MKYTVKPTKKQLRIIKKHWKTLQQMTNDYYGNVEILNSVMEQETGLIGIEFFMSEEGGYCGVGNINRTMKLIQF